MNTDRRFVLLVVLVALVSTPVWFGIFHVIG